jgi:exopolysaccharide biosynthesis operon protein EpsL
MGSVVRMYRKPVRTIGAIAVASALLTIATPGRALDRDRITISPFATYSYDSNVFRVPGDINAAALIGRPERSDTILGTGIRLALDYPVARQRFFVEGRLTHNDFKNFDFLDHTATDTRATWYWQLGNDWSGEAGYNFSRALTSFGDFRLPVKNLESRHNPYLSARYRLGASAVLRGQVSYISTNNSSAVRTASDLEQTTYEAGFDFLPASGNTIGATVRHTEGNYPNRLQNGLPFTNDFTQDDIEANFAWRLSGLSVVTGAIGYSSRQYDQRSDQDFNGPTGRIIWEYTPTGKTKFTTVARREIVAYETITSSHALTESIGVNAEWAATAKTLFGARAEYRKRDFLTDNVVSFTGLPQRTDKTTLFSLNATYRPYRRVDVLFALAHEKRTSNVALSDYDANTASLTVQLTF